MDFIGGGAKNYSAFLKYMGDEKDLGSPFQINYPRHPPSEKIAFDPSPRNCFDADLGSRCACVDCPSTCPVLSYVPPPGTEPVCQIGSISCLSFILILAYGLASAALVVGYLIEVSIRHRREKTYERVALSGDAPPGNASSPGSHSRALVGASSLAQYLDGEDSTGGQSESRHLGRGASLLDPIETLQPRQYRLNTFLRRTFYRLGASCANHPWLTFCIVFTLISLLNIGWRKFEVETDPVRLWVSPSSESKLQKEFFDDNFGPFYRTEQIFITPASSVEGGEYGATSEYNEPVLTWSRLKWWFQVEKEIRALRSSPNSYTLADVCFKPAGPQGPCVVQSLTAWFDYSLDNYNETTWVEHMRSCASQPSNCLPDFQQPLVPQYVLGGVPGTSNSESINWLDARAFIVTYVVSDSLDIATKQKAEEWEHTLKAYLQDLAEESPQVTKSNVIFSTGVSLEEELNKSTNMDIKIVVLSYFVMFIYVSLTLGNGKVGPEEEGIWKSLKTWAINFPRLFRRQDMISSSSSFETPRPPRIFPQLPRRLFIGSKFTLGLFGITLVILSVSSSVGIFSLLGVKVTLIIAEVIPFLVLAVGVDNVFILVHELDRQNMVHGPNALSTASGVGFPTPLSPTSPRRSPFDHMLEDSVDTDSVPLHLSPEERVARTLAKMGPSILLSSLSETVAFALGALVPMPAVRNFALYAAGSVVLNAVLQVTVFISALTIDLRRLEVSILYGLSKYSSKITSVRTSRLLSVRQDSIAHCIATCTSQPQLGSNCSFHKANLRTLLDAGPCQGSCFDNFWWHIRGIRNFYTAHTTRPR